MTCPMCGRTFGGDSCDHGRAGRMAAEAVGRTFTVRVRKASRTRSGIINKGVIVRCEVVSSRSTACAVVSRWRVVLQGPDGSTFGPFVVEALPRS